MVAPVSWVVLLVVLQMVESSVVRLLMLLLELSLLVLLEYPKLQLLLCEVRRGARRSLQMRRERRGRPAALHTT